MNVVTLALYCHGHLICKVCETFMIRLRKTHKIHWNLITN